MFNLSQRSEENTNTKRHQVIETRDYSMFKHITGNRDLVESNIQAIANQILHRGQQQPIIINERNEIIDGQHRLEACKRLRIAVKYIKQHGANLEDVISTNIVGKKWTATDYINRFAAEGNEDYIKLQKFINTANDFGFAPSVAVRIAQGTHTVRHYVMCEDGVVRDQSTVNKKNNDHKNLYSVGNAVFIGKFVMNDEQGAYTRLQQIYAFNEWPFYKKSGFVLAIMQCMRITEMDFDRLILSARKYPRKWHNEASTDNFVQMFEEVYNWRRQNKMPIVNNPQRRK